MDTRIETASHIAAATGYVSVTVSEHVLDFSLREIQELSDALLRARTHAQELESAARRRIAERIIEFDLVRAFEDLMLGKLCSDDTAVPIATEAQLKDLAVLDLVIWTGIAWRPLLSPDAMKSIHRDLHGTRVRDSCSR